MRTVTKEEIVESAERIRDMTESESRKFAQRLEKEQPHILLYVSAIIERGDFEKEGDGDAFASLSSIVWRAMRRAAGRPLEKIKAREIDAREERIMQLLRYAEGESEYSFPDLVRTWLKDYNQRPLMEFALEALLSPENPYDVSEESSGMIFTYLKVLIDCLDNAKPKRIY